VRFTLRMEAGSASMRNDRALTKYFSDGDLLDACGA
jgi:hypothetical protein